MTKDARLIASIALLAIAAIVALTDSDRAANETFTVTESPPSVEAPEPAPAVPPEPAQPAEIVCTFRCAACKRAPTLTYHEGDELPIVANCKQCGRSMPRTDPKLSDDERAKLPKQKTASVSRRAVRAACST